MPVSITHFEIRSDDPARIEAFYRDLFGWRFQKVGGFEYWTIATRDEGQPGINGALARRGGLPEERIPGFLAHFNVPSVDAVLARVEELGGRIRVPKTAIPSVGWFAVFEDPDGNALGLFQSDRSAR